MEPHVLQHISRVCQCWDDVVLMEEEEQLPQVCKRLKHAVWRVGVHLCTGIDWGGGGEWDEGHLTASQSCEPLWTGAHPLHSLRRLFFDPEDEVRGVF